MLNGLHQLRRAELGGNWSTINAPINRSFLSQNHLSPVELPRRARQINALVIAARSNRSRPRERSAQLPEPVSPLRDINQATPLRWHLTRRRPTGDRESVSRNRTRERSRRASRSKNWCFTDAVPSESRDVADNDDDGDDQNEADEDEAEDDETTTQSRLTRH